MHVLLLPLTQVYYVIGLIVSWTVMCEPLCLLLQLLADLQAANAKVAQVTECLEKREAELGQELKAALAKGEEQQQR